MGAILIQTLRKPEAVTVRLGPAPGGCPRGHVTEIVDSAMSDSELA